MSKTAKPYGLTETERVVYWLGYDAGTKAERERAVKILVEKARDAGDIGHSHLLHAMIQKIEW